MEHIAKHALRLLEATCLAGVLIFATLLILYSQSPLQAAQHRAVENKYIAAKNILPESGTYHGAVIHLEQVDAFECMVGKQLKVIKVYQFFKDDDFYQNWADFIYDQGAIEFLSFDPVVSDTITIICNGKEITASRTLHPDEVLSGAYDEVIERFASHIKAWGHPLILSFAGEMNGCWCPPVNWQGCYNDPNSPQKYIQMYRYVHDKFKAMGADNVTWAWVVNHKSLPDEAWNQVDNYYPGDSYVDIISVDGYNWGDDELGGWKTFNQIFSTTLTSLSNSYPTKPLMLGEFASVEDTNPMSKANWITDAYGHIKTDWPQIKAALWFNFPGEWSFPVESSPESIRAYREAIADPHFIGERVCYIYLPVVIKAN
jgi:hypothetical protein